MDEHTKACLQAILAKKQMQIFNPSAGWFDCDENTVLAVFSSELYRSNVRIKPEPMCELAGVQYPMPMQEAPKVDTAYWLAKSNGNGPDCEEWQGLEIERQWLAANICHATKEAAEAHSKAMLAVNAQAVAVLINHEPNYVISDEPGVPPPLPRKMIQLRKDGPWYYQGETVAPGDDVMVWCIWHLNATAEHSESTWKSWDNKTQAKMLRLGLVHLSEENYRLHMTALEDLMLWAHEQGGVK